VELDRTTYVISSTGYLSTIEYAGRGWVSGQKNSFTATLTKGKDNLLYKISGQWTGESTYTSILHPAQKNVPFWNAKSNSPTHIVVPPTGQQTAWESRKVWERVAEAIDKNDVDTAGRYKSAIEIGQRRMREEETGQGEPWKQRFFRWVEEDGTASGLRDDLEGLTGRKIVGGNVGSWVFKPDEEDQKALETGKLFQGV
jgi:oxysterol-binding protein-related protein 9/10/11